MTHSRALELLKQLGGTATSQEVCQLSIKTYGKKDSLSIQTKYYLHKLRIWEYITYDFKNDKWTVVDMDARVEATREGYPNSTTTTAAI